MNTKFTLSVLLALMCLPILGQGQIVVSPLKFSYAYRGVDNPIDIAVKGWDESETTYSVSEGHELIFLERENGRKLWSLKPGKPAEATITASREHNGKIETIESEKFRVLALPDPEPRIGHIGPSADSCSRADLNTPGMRAIFKDFDFDAVARIKSFKMEIITGGKAYSHLDSDGWAFSSTQYAYLKALQSGDKVIIYDIRAQLPDGTTRALKNIAVTIE